MLNIYFLLFVSVSYFLLSPVSSQTASIYAHRDIWNSTKQKHEDE